MSYEHINRERLRVFKMAEEIGRVPASVIPLTPAQEDRANRINEECISDEIVENDCRKGRRIGIHAIPNVLSRDPDQGIEDVLRNIDHVVKVAGIESTAVGTDTFFGDHVGMHRKMLESVSLGKELDAFPAPYMKGIENPGEFSNIARGLVKRGYSDEEIEKIVGANALRVFEEVVG